LKINRGELKQRSKDLIKAAKPSVILVALIYTALSFFIYILSARLMGVNITELDAERYLQYVADGNVDYALATLDGMEPPTSSYLISLVLQVMSSIIGAGFVIFLLNTIRKAGACVGNLLDGFGFFLKIILLEVLEGIFIFLWSLLLVFPGIIAAYRYRMALYILVDNPELSARQCLRKSKEMMKGHKWELFVVDLSFIGWSILASLPMLGYAVQIWTVPYTSLTYALYYEKLSGRDIYAAGSSGETMPPPWEF
jgi:hypothetical protein